MSLDGKFPPFSGRKLLFLPSLINHYIFFFIHLWHYHLIHTLYYVIKCCNFLSQSVPSSLNYCQHINKTLLWVVDNWPPGEQLFQHHSTPKPGLVRLENLVLSWFPLFNPNNCSQQHNISTTLYPSPQYSLFSTCRSVIKGFRTLTIEIRPLTSLDPLIGETQMNHLSLSPIPTLLSLVLLCPLQVTWWSTLLSQGSLWTGSRLICFPKRWFALQNSSQLLICIRPSGTSLESSLACQDSILSESFSSGEIFPCGKYYVWMYIIQVPLF